MFADGTQVPDVYGGAVIRAHDEARPIGAERRKFGGAKVGALEVARACGRSRSRRAKRHVWRPEPDNDGYREKSRVLSHRFGAPLSSCPTTRAGTEEPCQKPFPVGTENSGVSAVDGQLGHVRGVADPPDPGAGLGVTTGCQPFSVRADSDAAAVVEWSHPNRPRRAS